MMTDIDLPVIYTDQRLLKKYGGLQYTRADDVAIDLRACFGMDDAVGAYQVVAGGGASAKVKLCIKPGECKTVSAGFKMELPPGTMAAIHPRGGAGTRGLVLGNLTGVIDIGYQGEVFICLWNRSKEDIEVEAYERVSQMVILPIIRAKPLAVTAFTSASERGEGNLGSSGTV